MTKRNELKLDELKLITGGVDMIVAATMVKQPSAGQLQLPSKWNLPVVIDRR